MRFQTLLRVVLPAVLCTVVAASSSLAQDAIGTAPPAKATIQQVAFITGRWTGMLGDRHIEQHWMAPAGTSMVAAYRNLQGTKAMLYELLVIEEQEGGLVLRIKHFEPGPGLKSREPQGEAAEHRLVKVVGEVAVFESTGPNALRITFSKPSPDELSIVLDRMRDGQPVKTVFPYTRVK
ncbi:hypothetical protein LuPra_02040 [Luteitalea pratensis]|uniref:DUF6265 domain-containing protein n=1 Tax=Luteitalea pratensis TaxID=1855912 RepID=A0A143PM34_LUTPR|nr:DUF6265 family protein [Luteitalea pratensis]AMY08834.1 hypothetical protein LuPra_02040 [Luteitalea pratensis]